MTEGTTTLSTSSDARCIYCYGPGPFTSEHVIPAGLGADDKRFVLKNIVCKDCNTKVFSPLELAFLRNSPTALGRMFMQAEGRKRGGKGDPPKLDAKTKVMITDEGYTAEIELEAHGRPTVLPQLILVGDRKCSMTGSDQNGFLSFASEARDLLGSDVTCAHRSLNAEQARFEIAHLCWLDGKYIELEKFASNSLPSPHIWHATLEPRTNGQQTSNTRLFKRLDGQIMLRNRPELGIADALTQFRKAIEQADLSSIRENEVRNPLIQMDLSVRTDVTGRVLAKIGINMLAYLLGADYAGHPQFQGIKSAIRTGSPEIPFLLTERKDAFKTLFSGVPNNLHCFILAAMPEPPGTCSIGLVARLYGSHIEAVSLGRNLPPPRGTFPIFFTVDYTKHRVDQYAMMDFIKRHPFSMHSPASNPRS